MYSYKIQRTQYRYNIYYAKLHNTKLYTDSIYTYVGKIVRIQIYS